MISIHQQIECVEREITMRRSVYPGRVAAGKMRQDDADNQIQTMCAVLDTLKAQSPYYGAKQKSLFN